MRRRQGALAQRRPSSHVDSSPDASRAAGRPASAHHYRGRARAILSAAFIFVVLVISASQRSRTSRLPLTYGVCSPRGKSLIYTVDDNLPTVQCIVVSDDRIVDRGSLPEIRKHWGDKDTTGPAVEPRGPEIAEKAGTKIFHLKPGEALYPGFTDAHAHIIGYGQSRQLPLTGSPSAEGTVSGSVLVPQAMRNSVPVFPSAVVQRVVDYVQGNPDIAKDPTTWIEGQGWNQNIWPGQAYPTADDLDVDILRDRPIILYRIDVHAVWVSRKVLELLDPLPETIEGGEVVRDSEGRPTGVLIDNAMLLVEAIKPAWTESQVLSFFRTAITDAVRFGLTSIHDASSFPPMIDFFTKMADEDKLPIRIYPMAHLDDGSYWGDEFRRFEHPSGKLSVKSVKLFTDGALGSFGAALLEPYSDQPGTRGSMIFEEETISAMIEEFVKNGWQTNVHCIGDRANRVVLDAFESALAKWNASSVGRHRIEHAQIITPEDIERFAGLGVIPSMQPTHATSDMGYAEQRLGQERIKGAYAWQTLLKTGVPVVIGSDAPVESLNPILGFYAAISRLAPDGTSPHGPEGWYPAERLTRAQALRGMTLDAAYASFSEADLGSLEVGKKADLVVLDRDILTVPFNEVVDAKVKATIVDGRLVYGKL